MSNKYELDIMQKRYPVLVPVEMNLGQRVEKSEGQYLHLGPILPILPPALTYINFP